MAIYVDGFVIPVPKKKRAVYTKMAREGKKMWMKFGALDYKECVMDDAKPQWVTLTFPKLAKVKPGEEVWFSFIVFKNRKHRDEVNKKVMKLMDDPKYKDQPMPFDMKRFSYGGFQTVVE